MLNTETLRLKLEVSTGVAVLVVSGILLSTSLTTYMRERQPQKTGPGLRKGETLNRLEGYDFSQSTKTLVIVMNTDCESCVESIRFYNNVAYHCNSTDHEIDVRVVFPDPFDQAQRFVKQHQLKAEVIPQVDPTVLKVSVTPTVILVDSKGRILNFWIGQLSPKDEEEIINTLQAQ
jgi:hypothetical protein